MRLGIAMALALAGLIAFPVGRAQADGDVPDHVLVQLQTEDDASGIDDDYGTEREDHIQTIGLDSFKVPATTTAEQFASALRADSRVAWAETDKYILPPEVDANPFHFAFDSGPNPGAYVNQSAYSQIDVGKVRLLATGAGVVVAVLDTGATYTHPALIRNYMKGYNVLDPTQPPLDIADGVTNEGVGHGTMVAGIIVHIAPKVKILPVRVLNGDGIGTIFDVAKGIDYAVKHGAKVINMSFGGRQTSQALNMAIDEANNAGVILIAAGGNDGVNAPYYPAACDNVIGVASVEADNTRSPWSNWGLPISIAAPGDGIRSTYYTGGYADWAGTSFAAPFISATAALMLSYNHTVTANQVINALEQTTQDVSGEGLGEGLVDVLKAVQSVK
jgi:subtilisin family serine protease